MTTPARKAAEAIGLYVNKHWCLDVQDDDVDAVAAIIREKAVERQLQEAYAQLRWAWNQTHSCACGARRESVNTHPHVCGCPTAAALAALAERKEPSVEDTMRHVMDNYGELMRRLANDPTTNTEQKEPER